MYAICQMLREQNLERVLVVARELDSSGSLEMHRDDHLVQAREALQRIQRTLEVEIEASQKQMMFADVLARTARIEASYGGHQTIQLVHTAEEFTEQVQLVQQGVTSAAKALRQLTTL